MIRWTVGNVPPVGMEVLLESIASWQSVYGTTFNMVVCYNEIPNNYISMLSNVPNIILFDQRAEYKQHKQKYFWTPKLCGWKLCPPRMSFDTHEIFCDNDIVFTKRLPTIDKFLESKNMVFNCRGKGKAFGNFKKFIPRKITANNGFFGVYPGFYLNRKIKIMQRRSKLKSWTNFLDEQGMMTAIMVRQKNFVQIELNEMSVCHTDLKIANGIHFVGLNAMRTRAWEQYRRYAISM